MFNMDFVVDAVQNTKKQFVNTFVTNEKIASALNEFIDTQTSYTKSMNKSVTESMTVISQEAMNMMKDYGKFDHSKFHETFTKPAKK